MLLAKGFPPPKRVTGAEVQNSPLSTRRRGLLAAARLQAQARRAQQRMSMFPTVQAKNLEGRTFTLPEDLEGELSCVVVAFHRQHQQLVDTWLPRIAELAEQHPELRYYEMPTISRRWATGRAFIDGGMAQAIADREARERTVTVYANVRPIVAALGLANTDTITTVLVDMRGEIVWQATGPMTEESARDLEAAVIAQLAPA